MEPKNWQAVLDVHLNGAYNVSRPAFRVMREKGYGRIVMTTSTSGLYGNFGQANYSAAKMALVGLMNTLKLEGKKYNILVNTVAPMATTRLTEDVFPPDFIEKAKPEFVTPLVIYLCSDRCPVSGNIYNAGMGCFSRAAVITGPGAVVGDANRLPTVEAIMDNLDKISTIKNGKEYSHLNDHVADALTAFSSPDRSGEKSQHRFKSVSAVFDAMPNAFVPDASAGLDVVFQYSISGKDSGDWFCVVKDNICIVESGTNEKPTCTLKIADTDFLDMMNGMLIPMKAYTSGKLKIEGDIMKSQLIEKLFKLY
jgi:putative sterol carrier protein